MIPLELIQQEIRMFHLGYQICGGMGILGLVCSMYCFFRFRVLDMIGNWTGYSVRKHMKQMEARNYGGGSKAEQSFWEAETEELPEQSKEEKVRVEEGKFQIEKKIMYIHVDQELGDEKR